MIKKVILIKGICWYEIIDHNDDKLAILASFLREEISNPDGFFSNWLNGKLDQDHAYGNGHGLEEHDGQVYVYFAFGSEDERKLYFRTTKEKMLAIVNRWMAMARTIWIDRETGKQILPPDEIVISQDENGEVRIDRTDGFDPADLRTISADS